MRIQDDALLLSVRPSGENGAVVRLFLRQHGVRAAYVHGARSRSRRAVLQPGGLLSAEIEGRSEGRLPIARLESQRARDGLMTGALPLAVIPWLTGILAGALAEGDPHADLFGRADALLDLLALGPDGPVAARALAEFEASLLAELGFALDLSECAVTGAVTGTQLAYVSPRTGRAVTQEGAAGYEARLLPLPAFLLDRAAPAGRDDLLAALRLTRHFLVKDILAGQRGAHLEKARDLIDARLARLL
ncbi:DNA repair protein RecO [Pacificimonas flava]|uniref:DNA repair protein RecO n=2 Tax=Pacificimonas TaxID=1960290 RepID=A0A219B767_9SPHN|nr:MULTISPECIES: DNA repair protein RecO [Pacificimonas]MBZ6378487.1 DNA repair protein RecO [Pacificimonas aurantium]OWV34220.1 DNA repair protein RecO [Pacificimonas flava]